MGKPMPKTSLEELLVYDPYPVNFHSPIENVIFELMDNYFSIHNASDTKCMYFSHQAILQFSADTNWISYNLIQF